MSLDCCKRYCSSPGTDEIPVVVAPVNSYASTTEALGLAERVMVIWSLPPGDLTVA